MEPRHRKSWRLNMLLFRAYHDALIFSRLVQSSAIEARVREAAARRVSSAQR